MKLDYNELEMIHEALDALRYEAQEALDDDDVNPATARWAYETIDSCDDLSDKIEIVMETVKNLQDRDVACDISLTPGSAKL
jgi:hypothetical protein